MQSLIQNNQVPFSISSGQGYGQSLQGSANMQLIIVGNTSSGTTSLNSEVDIPTTTLFNLVNPDQTFFERGTKGVRVGPGVWHMSLTIPSVSHSDVGTTADANAVVKVKIVSVTDEDLTSSSYTSLCSHSYSAPKDESNSSTAVALNGGESIVLTVVKYISTPVFVFPTITFPLAAAGNSYTASTDDPVVLRLWKLSD